MEKGRLHRAQEDLRLEKSWEREGVTVLRAKVTLPQFEGRRARRLNRYYRRFALSFLKYCEAELYPRAAALCREKMAVSAPWSVSRAALSYTVTYESEAFLSLYTDAAEEALPPRQVLRRADTWELSTALPLPLAALFAGGTWKKALRRRFRAEARERTEAGRSEFYPDYRRSLRSCFSSRNFYLTADGIRLFYQMRSVAPAREGVVEFFIPYGEEGLQRAEDAPADGAP